MFSFFQDHAPSARPTTDPEAGKPRSPEPLIPQPDGRDFLSTAPVMKEFALGEIWKEEKDRCKSFAQPDRRPILKRTHSSPTDALPKRVYWQDLVTTRYIEPRGRMLRTNIHRVQEKEANRKARKEQTGRSHFWRNQIKQIVAAFRGIQASSLLQDTENAIVEDGKQTKPSPGRGPP